MTPQQEENAKALNELEERALEFWNNSPCQAHPAQVLVMFAWQERSEAHQYPYNEPYFEGDAK